MKLIIALLALDHVTLLAAITPVPEKIACAVADRQDFAPPDRLKLEGWVGSRIEANEANRLVKIDTARLLEGYRKCPGRQSWDGDHREPSLDVFQGEAIADPFWRREDSSIYSSVQ